MTSKPRSDPASGPRIPSGSPLPAADGDPSFRAPLELFEVLWRLHLEIMRAGNCEAAYHALAAALHCAERARGVVQVGSVESIAAMHQAELDALVPQNPHSTAAAHERGTVPVFTSLEATARAMSARMRADRALEDSRARREPFPG